MLTVILLLLGLVGLVVGGDLLVRGAERLATRLGVSPLLIGLTIVGFGTSTPELVTSLQAAFLGSPGISFGNVVGSNTANILLILGLTALISSIPVDGAKFRRDAIALALSAGVAIAVVFSGTLTLLAGILMIAGLVAYIVWCIRDEQRTPAPVTVSESAAPLPSDRAAFPGLNLILVVAGIALTIAGANGVVFGAIRLARMFDMSETVIGLTIVAVGTSLPEMVASVMAALRRQTAIALGNVVGSNIYNILFILGITAVVKPIPVPPSIVALDIWVMTAATLALIATGLLLRQVNRWTGLVFLSAYLAYTVWLVRMGTGGTL